MGKRRGGLRVLVGKSEVNKPRGRSGHKRNNNIITYLQEIKYGHGLD
jgi:hypothetical protein